jgi:hypothetical protein
MSPVEIEANERLRNRLLSPESLVTSPKNTLASQINIDVIDLCGSNQKRMFHPSNFNSAKNTTSKNIKFNENLYSPETTTKLDNAKLHLKSESVGKRKRTVSTVRAC